MIFVILTTILTLGFVSAGIFIEPLNEVYNYGDFLNAPTNIISTSSASGHYSVDLICENNLTIAVFNQFIMTQPNFERHFQIETQLLNSQLKNMSQNCNLKAVYNGEITYSSSFKMSSQIDVESSLEYDELSPGKSVSVSGTAIKESLVPLNGFVEIFIHSLNLYKSGSVSEGIFNLTLLLPKNVKSGKHNITISVHDDDGSGKKLNSGDQHHIIKILQILEKFEIVTEKENIEPGEEFIFLIDARDQAGDPIPGQVNIVISEPNGLPYIKKIIKQGEHQKVPFSLNNSPGYWSVEATVDGKTKRKLFYLAEVPQIQTSLINSTLLVTNIGNADYAGPLEITIGSHVEVKQLNLKIGETQKFTLRAPEGTYSISVLENGEQQNLGSTFLTGRAIDVADPKQDLVDTIKDPFVWGLVLVLFVVIVILVRVRLGMKNRLPNPSVSNSSALSGWEVKKSHLDETFVKKEEVEDLKTSSKNMPVPSFKPSNPLIYSDFKTISSAVQKPIVQKPKVVTNPTANPFIGSHEGVREKAVVLAIRASGPINSTYTSQTINSALSIVQETGAKIYIDGDYKIVLFSPRLTKFVDNDVTAVNAARRVESLFAEHNKIYDEKISFGLGVSDGDIISEIEKGVFHFTSAGNIISLGKKIAQTANMKLLLSDSVRKKVINTIKTEQLTNTGFWEVTRVVDRNSSSGFVKDFVRRNK